MKGCYSSHFLVLVFLLLIAGCGRVGLIEDGGADKPDFNISFHDMLHEEFYDVVTNSTISNISFVMKNEEVFPLECAVVFSMENSTVSEGKTQDAGIFGPGSRKRVSIVFSMISGSADLKMYPACKRS